MATFSAIISTEYAVGAPITNSWGSKVSNNVLAIIQGDATASSNRIQTNALASNAVTTAKINTSAVTANEIASNAVTTAKINTSAVTANEIASNAVTTAKINTSATTRPKLSTSTVSLAGTVSATSKLSIALSPYSFFPMIHTPNGLGVAANVTDLANPDSPVFTLSNGGVYAETYDVDYRYILA